LLARVASEEAIALAETDGPTLAEDEEAPPRELLGTVLDLTKARRRRRRWTEVGLSAAAALIIAAGVFGGLRLSSNPAQGGQSGLPVGTAAGSWETTTGQTAGMTATVMYRSMGWGTQLAAKVTGIPVGTMCQMYVVGSDGSRTLVGSWVTDNAEGHVWYPLSAAVSSVQVHKFVITVSKARSITVAA
jgi:hypothetical protein